MTIGIFTLELHLPTARSLKDKRQVVRRLKDRLRSRFNVAVAEIDEHLDLWQRGGLMIVSVASSRDALSHLFESIVRVSAARGAGVLIPGHPAFIESSAGGSAGWSEEWE